MKNSELEAALNGRMIPKPKNIVFREGECVISDGVPVEIGTAEDDEAFSEQVAELFREYWNAEPEITVRHSSKAETFSEDQYEAEITRNGIRLTAHCEKGLQLALKTLRQLAEPMRETLTTQCYVIQPCLIRDQADCEFRAAKLRITPETTLTEAEKKIRLAAAWKFRYVIVKPEGVFPFKSHPEFGWKDQMKSASFYRALLDAADDCGISLIPAFDIFHQADLSGSGSGKHELLSFRKEFAPLFEPGGHNWCQSNPQAQEIIADLVLELHDFFEQPEYFHIGGIGGSDFRLCRKCLAKKMDRLLLDHIRKLYAAFGPERPRFLLEKRRSAVSQENRNGKNSGSAMISIPSDLLLELRPDEKFPEEIDAVADLTEQCMELPENCGGVTVSADVSAEQLARAAEIAWNGRETAPVSPDAVSGSMLQVVQDMDLQHYSEL